MYWPFVRKEDYEGDADENNCNNDYSRSENDDFVENLDKEQDYKEYDDLIVFVSVVFRQFLKVSIKPRLKILYQGV